MHVVNMPRMQPQGMPPYNMASQAGMGGGINPSNMPMQRGVAAQAHQQQVFYNEPNTSITYCQLCPVMDVFIIWFQMRRKDQGMGMTGFPPQQKRRF